MTIQRIIIATALTVLMAAAAVYAQNDTPADVAGTWTITLDFVSGSSTHTAVIVQDRTTLSGTYKGAFLEGSLRGSVKGNTVRFTGAVKNEAQTIRFTYNGTVNGGSMSGTVDMGEFWTGKFTAKRK